MMGSSREPGIYVLAGRDLFEKVTLVCDVRRKQQAALEGPILCRLCIRSIINRMAGNMFQCLQYSFILNMDCAQASNSSGITVYISFYEIYGGKLFDLFHGRKRLEAREDAHKNVVIAGMHVKCMPTSCFSHNHRIHVEWCMINGHVDSHRINVEWCMINGHVDSGSSVDDSSVVAGLQEKLVENVDDLMELIDYGNKVRSTGNAAMKRAQHTS